MISTRICYNSEFPIPRKNPPNTCFEAYRNKSRNSEETEWHLAHPDRAYGPTAESGGPSKTIDSECGCDQN